jgi:hypothetical protein
MSNLSKQLRLRPLQNRLQYDSKSLEKQANKQGILVELRRSSRVWAVFAVDSTASAGIPEREFGHPSATYTRDGISEVLLPHDGEIHRIN